ncbi:MAG: hypothetical protein FWB83_06565 [Treponema sp.]|nr:hypothetical protein [Treponema sp.]
MKKFLVFILVAALSAGFAAAQESDGIGITAGLEFGISDVTSDASQPYLWASLGYENSFGDLDFSTGLALDVGFGDESYQDLYFDLALGYNIGLGGSSTLSLLLANNMYFAISSEADDIIAGILKPGVMFTQETGAGDIFVTAEVPVAYLYFGADMFFGIDITAGWNSTFGLGFDATGHIQLSDEFGDDNKGFTGLDLTVFYEAGSIYFEVAASIPFINEGAGPSSFFDFSLPNGISVTPLFGYTIIPGLQVYASCKFFNIGIKDADIGITPAIGVTYSF